MSLVNLLCNEIDRTKVDMKKYLSHPDENGHTPLHMGCQRGATISCMQLKKVSEYIVIYAYDMIRDKSITTSYYKVAQYFELFSAP